jgi:hypothetical protein
MEVANTHLGTPELHHRHSVMIEGGMVPRSKVMDQCIFDRYLMECLINLSQHRAAEFMLSLAAGFWATGVQLENGYIDAPKGSKIPFKTMPFGNVARRISEELSDSHCLITKKVIINNKDVRKLKNGIRLFSGSMDFVSNRVMFFHKNPLRHLE